MGDWLTGSAEECSTEPNYKLRKSMSRFPRSVCAACGLEDTFWHFAKQPEDSIESYMS